VFKWLCFALATAFLAAFLWMVNDMRLGVQGLVDRLDQQLPPILTNTEQASKRINDQLPEILTNTRQAAKDINSHLPKLLEQAQKGVDQLAKLAKGFKEFKDFFAFRRAPRRNNDRIRIAGNLPSPIEARDTTP
jgi:uncharacterized phage infection (PIP) family protein YhgE